nr:succinate:cytochrome c oxidoreductase subunit 4 [Coleochaete scutata]
MIRRFYNAYDAQLGHWLLQRITAALLIPTIFLANVSTLILWNILLFWHMHIGIEEILIDYVHNEVIRTWFFVLFRILILLIIKYTFVLFVLT